MKLERAVDATRSQVRGDALCKPPWVTQSKQHEEYDEKALVGSLIAVGLVAAGLSFPADAAVTKNWPASGTYAAPPFNQAYSVNNSPNGYVNFNGIVTSTYAQTSIGTSAGTYSDTVAVVCTNPFNTNQNNNTNGSVVVYCPFFNGTVYGGKGSVTATP